MYKEPKETTKLTESGGIIGVGEFLLVCSLSGKSFFRSVHLNRKSIYPKILEFINSHECL
jgi:hypothetical protein